MTQAQETINRLIAIDTEYHTDKHGRIDKVYCICAQNASGACFKRWLIDYKGDILSVIESELGVTNPIFICHALDKAERRALKFVGVDCSRYNFICTYHLAKMLQYTFSKSIVKSKLKDKSLPDTEKACISSMCSTAKANSLSYAGLCARYGLALIDTDHKEAMRKLCIEDNTTGNEQSIMDYCLEDTQFLIPLFKMLFNEYASLLNNSYCPLQVNRFKNLTIDKTIECLLLQSRYIIEFGDIADKGLPINCERISKVRENAQLWSTQVRKLFNEKYPGCFKLVNFELKMNTQVVERYLRECISRLNILDYPTTTSGKLSTSKDALKEYFKGRDCFGEDLRQLKKTLDAVKMCTKDYLDSIYDSRLWYESLEPYGTTSSRCAPKTSKFLFGWSKTFYGLLDPPKGKWLVELDYSSEETFCQACICRDDKYNEIYVSKDIYLAFANEMNMIPTGDWSTLSTSELKEKYKNVRSLVKPMILGMSYGMGAKTLASRLGIDRRLATIYLNKINNTIKQSYVYKQKLSQHVIGNRSRALSLPDGFVCKFDPMSYNAMQLMNFPFQSSGGMILRHLVHQINNSNIKCDIVATIHDAIVFLVDENDYDAIHQVSELMRTSANYILSANKDWSIKVGAPEIIKHGEIWCAGNEECKEQFNQLLNYHHD